jgi:predicted amino acid dehydrogenase
LDLKRARAIYIGPQSVVSLNVVVLTFVINLFRQVLTTARIYFANHSVSKCQQRYGSDVREATVGVVAAFGEDL